MLLADDSSTNRYMGQWTDKKLKKHYIVSLLWRRKLFNFHASCYLDNYDRTIQNIFCENLQNQYIAQNTIH